MLAPLLLLFVGRKLDFKDENLVTQVCSTEPRVYIFLSLNAQDCFHFHSLLFFLPIFLFFTAATSICSVILISTRFDRMPCILLVMTLILIAFSISSFQPIDIYANSFSGPDCSCRCCSSDDVYVVLRLYLHQETKECQH
jgi:hypothetical protein